MRQLVTYLFQFLAIAMLVCGYMLGDQPDSLSLMHINPNPDCPSVFSKSHRSDVVQSVHESESTTNPHSHKGQVPKFISFEIILPALHVFAFHGIQPVVHNSAIPPGYSFLFYREINPPPPKAC
jgi:hypothetical protein